MTEKYERAPVHEWTCGHVAGAVCGECYRLLAQRANQLAQEHMQALDELARLRAQNANR